MLYVLLFLRDREYAVSHSRRELTLAASVRFKRVQLYYWNPRNVLYKIVLYLLW